MPSKRRRAMAISLCRWTARAPLPATRRTAIGTTGDGYWLASPCVLVNPRSRPTNFACGQGAATVAKNALTCSIRKPQRTANSERSSLAGALHSNARGARGFRHFQERAYLHLSHLGTTQPQATTRSAAPEIPQDAHRASLRTIVGFAGTCQRNLASRHPSRRWAFEGHFGCGVVLSRALCILSFPWHSL